MSNTLFYGDNLPVLSQHVDDATVDLVYLDPPFNSNRDFNVLFKEQAGKESPAQIKAFGDTWNWAGAAEAWADFPALCPVPKVIELMRGFHNTLGENDVMAYLVMMAPRLYHLWRVLKPTGSLYLHCDPTASHYLKLILDAVFGAKNYRNEIIWKRTSAHNDTAQGLKRYGRNHDVIYFYTKTSDTTWNPHTLITAMITSARNTTMQTLMAAGGSPVICRGQEVRPKETRNTSSWGSRDTGASPERT